jgi:hypothetical protein
MRRSILAGLLAASGLLAVPALAADGCEPDGELVVTGLGTWSDELARLADLGGGLDRESGMIRRGGMTSRTICAGSAGLLWGDAYVARSPFRGLGIVPPSLTTAYQALAPGGSNDGMLWQGRGFSTLLSGGLRAAWGPFSAQLAPEVTWAQNQHFKMAANGLTGNLRFRNAYYADGLDVPQRYGNSPYARAGFGQSFLAVEGYGARLALSTENLWWGPGIRNTLLLTNTAEGFPHVSLKTSRPLDVWVGHVEAELVWGRLERSAYTAHRQPRAFNGLAVTFEPRWIPGLFLGVGRTYVEDPASLRKDSYLSVFEALAKSKVGGDNPADNQITAAWFRWAMPEIELYGEYGLDDFQSVSGISRFGDRAAAWLVGFQKRWVNGPRWWRVVGELAKTRSNLPPGYSTSFYTHGDGSDYTHEGQLLGASFGPGADTQYLAVDAFVPSGRIGGYFERIRRNEEVYWSQFATSRTADHDVELMFGVRQVILGRYAEVGWDVAAGYRWNRDFVQRYATNFRAMLTVSLPLDARPLLGGARAPADAAGATEPSTTP